MESIPKQGEHQYFRCTDCDIILHENDKQNHLNGARHRYRLRKKQPEDDALHKTQPQFQCSVCDTEFTDLHFYTIHQGSKTHKRNLKRLQRSKKLKKGKPLGTNEIDDHPVQQLGAGDFKPTPRRVPIHAFDTYLSISDFKDVCDYKSVREKYRPRNTDLPQGNNKAYVCSVTAYWAVSLALDPTVKDFKISLNDKEWGQFGDAVVQIDLKEAKEKPALSTTFAIQFKDISNNVKSIGSFGEGRFCLAKFMTQAQAIKLRQDVDNKKFVVFTTASAESNVERQLKLRADIIHKSQGVCDCKSDDKEIPIVTRNLSNRRQLLINTSDDNENIFFFFCTDNVHNIPKIYMYTHQKKQKHFANLINDFLARSLFGEKKVDIHREFVQYIEYWGDGYLGGNYKLKKEDVLVKIGHLLMFPYRIPPIVRSVEKQNYSIWQLAVSSVDVTILKKHPVIVAKVCEPINYKIETELNVKIDATNNTIDLYQETITNIQNPVLKMYLFEETMGEIMEDVPLDLVYDFFWKAGLVPLLLKIEDLKDQEYILNIINLLKSAGLTRRFFLMTPDKNIRATVKYYKNLTFFNTLDDIAGKLPVNLLDKIKINVTDQFSISLKEIQGSDPFFKKTIGAQEFLDMSLGRYSFKSCHNNLAIRNRQESQLVLEDDLMEKLRKEVELKDELKMALIKPLENIGQSHFLKGIRPNLFS
ncbi:uncharacterized protein LOC126739590 isoform X2 [Anthonomus grandis grandis]|uniref:uncharacterized protein LOC126739590 isoform X2 n=1 Tax=Anthonomus grandis grandis TaxID=2921223 RepID=UPI0021665985|nr:uncharacterized protein LOC126739590 isoform X2 [Anthonomus grandis grandis]XP_050301303.1 uncharacterized protein LOC126739590 isoform X2 [Anthonomus grandis grandis]